MAVIAPIEDAIVSALTAVFPRGVKIDTVPAGITADEWEIRLRAGNACYVAWLGGGVRDFAGIARIVSSFGVYVLASSAGAEPGRRRGVGVNKGAYAMVEMVVPAIHDLRVPGIGTLQLDDIGNFWNEKFDELGMALYVVTFAIPTAFDAQLALDDFLTFSGQIALDPTKIPADAALPLPDIDVAADILVTLPGPEEGSPHAS